MRQDCKIYVGNLPPDVKTRDLESLFIKYGPITDIDLKCRRGPPFAFIEFEDDRDAADAVRGRDGYNFDGYALRVEFPRGGGFNSFRRGGSRGGGGPSRRSDYRVIVTGLPPTGSWQDLKDHMREAGDVGFADVFKDGSGVVEFLRYEDMKYALKKLDDSKFRSHESFTLEVYQPATLTFVILTFKFNLGPEELLDSSRLDKSSASGYLGHLTARPL
ncbi:hypothetical protein AAHC03_09852 [Spirometra sp. Aus1]